MFGLPVDPGDEEGIRYLISGLIVVGLIVDIILFYIAFRLRRQGRCANNRRNQIRKVLKARKAITIDT